MDDMMCQRECRRVCVRSGRVWNGVGRCVSGRVRGCARGCVYVCVCMCGRVCVIWSGLCVLCVWCGRVSDLVMSDLVMSGQVESGRVVSVTLNWCEAALAKSFMVMLLGLGNVPPSALYVV